MRKFIETYHRRIAGVLFCVMAVLLIGSSWNDSAISDETPHIASGYTYWKTNDYRLNPEHPPLIKDISAIPLLFQNLNYPFERFYANLNIDQWVQGWIFLYGSGNDPDLMIRSARVPVMIITLMLAAVMFVWTKKIYGKIAAVLTTAVIAFEPTIITHGRFVTTDMGMTFTWFLHWFLLWKFLQKPSWRGLIFAGLTMGVAFLTKFSAPLIIISYIFLFVLLVIKPQGKDASSRLFKYFTHKSLLKRAVSYAGAFALVVSIGTALIYLVYFPHVSRMSRETMHAGIEEAIPAHDTTAFLHKLVDIPGFKPLAWYVVGFEHVRYHSIGGHRRFFLGELSNGSHTFYPVAFLIKNTLGFLGLLILSVVLFKKTKTKFFTELMILIPIVVYFSASVYTVFNLGVRHLLPIYPFLILFIGKLGQLIFNSKDKFNKAGLVVTVLLIAHVVSSTLVFPHYLSYFNEAIGGPKNGINYILDSSLDWGQDLKRLRKWQKQNNIPFMNIDYWGGGDIGYYFGNTAVKWGSEKGRPPKDSYFAISKSNYASALAREGAPDLIRDKTAAGIPLYGDPAYREWLKDLPPPIADIGYSIYVFRIP